METAFRRGPLRQRMEQASIGVDLNRRLPTTRGAARAFLVSTIVWQGREVMNEIFLIPNEY
jgi:hypothetical protein